MPATNSPAALTISSIVAVNGESYKVVSVDAGETKPLTRADLIASGFDGNHYTAERVLVGRQRVKRTALLARRITGEMHVIACM